MDKCYYPEHLVFGLDIGTRSIVGTVGYKENNKKFKVVAQIVKEHETRAMLDGQIHDIMKVSETIHSIKEELEEMLQCQLTDVCIAAAGRVLKTITVKADYEFPFETIVKDEHIYSLNSLGVEKAYELIRKETADQDIVFYCVGYTVIHYYLNGNLITNLEGHKAANIASELIATFLPEEVISGLYSAVEKAGLYVANLTLEPIAAINVAIPEKFRLLNICLVDVGAGTSDICITKEGSITAYGMMPFAGDEITECIAQHYLVDFQTAEKIKLACIRKKPISYKDIMGISHKITVAEVIEVVSDTVKMITKNVADKIIELNGGKSVSAVFIVGGGGKIPGFNTYLAEYLQIAEERVALRGVEVLQEVEFVQTGIKKDSTLVTPIGICLNFYEQRNNFIFVNINGKRIKLYNNDKLTIVDAAIQLGLKNEELFPRRGKELTFTVNGVKRMVRGELGEAAIVKLNGKLVGINAPIEGNDQIEIILSTVGEPAKMEVGNLPEYNSTISFLFNGKNMVCPKFVMAGNRLVSEFYDIQENEEIKILEYYTIEQVFEFMDITYYGDIYVNNVLAGDDEKVYANFSIKCDMDNKGFLEIHPEENNPLQSKEHIEKEVNSIEITKSEIPEEKTSQNTTNVIITVNGETVTLSGKKSYIFVDILDFYSFDLSIARGNSVIMLLNSQKAEFTDTIEMNDVVEIYWEE